MTKAEGVRVRVVMMTVTAVVVVVMMTAQISATSQHQQVFSNQVQRDGRLGVTFALKPCNTDNGVMGVCLPYFTCPAVKATYRGLCSYGLGHCCAFERTCGETSGAQVTYFVDSNTASTCSVSITKGKNVCQLRLTMEDLSLEEPDAEGACMTQYLHVTNVDTDSIKICGENDGQHLIVDVRSSSGPFKVEVVNSGSNTPDWRIKIEQIKCSSPNLAPVGCEQYYIGLTGNVKSFNYAAVSSSRTHPATDDTGAETTVAGTRHLQESYTICVKPESGYCGLKWTPGPDDIPFSISGGGTDEQLPPGLEGDIAEIDGGNRTDYLLIPGGIVPGDPEIISVFTGSEFPSEVTTSEFRMDFIVNQAEMEDDDYDNRGFYLQYAQTTC